MLSWEHCLEEYSNQYKIVLRNHERGSSTKLLDQYHQYQYKQDDSITTYYIWGSILPYTLFSSVSALMHATIFGNVTALVARLYGARKSLYQTKWKDLKDFTILHSVPKNLKMRMQDYFQTMWSLNHGIDPTEVSQYYAKYRMNVIGVFFYRFWRITRRNYEGMCPYICIEKFSVYPFLKRPLKAVENFCRSKSKRIFARLMNFLFIKAMLYTISIIYAMDPWKFYKMEWLSPF